MADGHHKAAVRTANEIASLFLAQKLAEGKERVQRWVANVLEAEAQGEVAHQNLFLHEYCNLGEMHVIISSPQSSWLYKTIARERRAVGKRILRHEGIASYEGREVGTWIWYESDDQYERMLFKLEVAFMREYMQADSTALQIVFRQIEEQ